MKVLYKQYLFILLFTSIGFFTKSFAGCPSLNTHHSNQIIYDIVPPSEHGIKFFAEAIDFEIQEEEEAKRVHFLTNTAHFGFLKDSEFVIKAISQLQTSLDKNANKPPQWVPTRLLEKLQVFII
ncbi:MAG: hypothetical protein ACI834_000603 [Colwellia sp.]|jgi:hypothetical protein